MNESNHPALDFYLLIPYYNNLTGLIRSLQSIRYSAVKYALLIVDDGSTTPLRLSDLKGVIEIPTTIHIIRQEPNQGITKALNAGLEWLRGRNDFLYVAR